MSAVSGSLWSLESQGLRGWDCLDIPNENVWRRRKRYVCASCTRRLTQLRKSLLAIKDNSAFKSRAASRGGECSVCQYMFFSYLAFFFLNHTMFHFIPVFQDYQCVNLWGSSFFLLGLCPNHDEPSCRQCVATEMCAELRERSPALAWHLPTPGWVSQGKSLLCHLTAIRTEPSDL